MCRHSLTAFSPVRCRVGGLRCRLNLLIAIMGGSFEDISENAAPEILRQKAELLLSIIAEMSDHDKNLAKFPVRPYMPDDSLRRYINALLKQR